ncbi:hypothetical protein CoNPh32_CDS0007 [Staphylococcus phage S-CoN_Ph32]|nr:hypothetical protein CoNPh32_CDS0007 [Staphylococcus phage S-CoN_Ph32]
MLAFEKSIIDVLEKAYAMDKGFVVLCQRSKKYLSRTLNFLDDIACEYKTINDKDNNIHIVIDVNSYKGV